MVRQYLTASRVATFHAVRLLYKHVKLLAVNCHGAPRSLEILSRHRTTLSFVTMFWTTILGFTTVVGAVPQFGGGGGLTMLRFGCSQVVIDRLDPLVNPGSVPSPHVHQIVGGNSFNATMTTGDVSQQASCTTCAFSEDFSNYWTANLYFKARNGTYKRVPQGGAAYVPCTRTMSSFPLLILVSRLEISLADLTFPLRYQFNDNFSTQTAGGILVYYVSAQPGKITAFKPVRPSLLDRVRRPGERHELTA
jgi:hypothetical protein